jgi:hypothetical protein
MSFEIPEAKEVSTNFVTFGFSTNLSYFLLVGYKVKPFPIVFEIFLSFLTCFLSLIIGAFS